MIKTFLVIFNLIVGHVCAQQELWHQGAVVTSDDEVLTGEILFQSGHDLLVFRRGDQAIVMTSSKVSSFRFFDESANINRKFVSLLERKGLAEKKIYEVVLYGAIPVLRKGKNIFDTNPSDLDGYNYYFVWGNVVWNLQDFASRAYSEMRVSLLSEERRLHLSPYYRADAIRLIELYNSLHLDLAAAK